MRLSQLVTLYLAAAAPVGVLVFLRRHADAARARAVARAATAGLLFPFTLAAYALARGNLTATASSTRPRETHEEKIEAARKALVAALHGFGDRARAAGGRRADAAALAAHALTSTVERYAGLTLALAGAEPGGEPDERETELARVAGRGGEDLEIAGRCVRRRNASRLREHQARSRLELLHALAELQDTLEGIDEPCAVRRSPSAAGPPRQAGASGQRMSAALLRVYERAFELLLLLEDARGVQSLVRLLDATRARLYRHREEVIHAAHEDAAGGQSCTPHRSQAAPAALTTPRPPTPISTRA
ncbi:MAG TPA: hypothetical protein VM864_01085 [Pyrinomonadaceae bacterium]|jgi:hypothetical protein|nr:hypothetical protein [Pyrinomonadaceae bacterium]